MYSNIKAQINYLKNLTRHKFLVYLFYQGFHLYYLYK